MKRGVLPVVALVLATARPAWAADAGAEGAAGAVTVAALIGLVALAAYARVAVVLAVLRSALGSVPPRSVAALLALVLSVFVMLPTAERAVLGLPSGAARSEAGLAAVAAAAQEPMRAFLVAHTPEGERRSFVELARRLRPVDERARVDEQGLAVLAPAFLVAELRAAFEIGFLVYLPFLVLELVIAVLLVTLGMHALDPRAVSLPFKLLLFVAADGWHLLARGIVLGYT